ncbi:BEC protein [Streptomyces litmocidini]|uniref:acyl-CoA dehydrogenase family protein n=1 Tax=Streptomyces litmocidini TaxID=67318 RepID=UPI00167D72AF|nr:acyl-CoA dehydrogenase family protein [Streptomyces litmocidini]GGU80616.1 BEC protein [Streptomyces litmocidini]
MSAPAALTTQRPPATPLDARVGAVLPVLREDADRIDDAAAFPVRGLAALRESGLMGLLVPQEHGGLGGSSADLTHVAQELAGECLSTAMIWAMHCQQVAALTRHGSPRLKAHLLPRIARGEVYVASVTSEKAKGGHLLSAHSPLTGEGDGTLRFDRDAPIVTGGAHADGFLITLRDGPEAAPHRVTAVYADRDRITVEEGPDRWNPMGMRGTHSIPLRLSGTVDETAVVGRRGGFKDVAVADFVPAGHLAWAACWLGAVRGALRSVLKLLRSPAGRRQFDLSGQQLRARLARVRMELDAMAALLTQVTADSDRHRGTAGAESPPVQMRLNALKVYTAERSFACVDELIRVVGLRHGYMRRSGLPLERLFRDLRSAGLNYADDRLLAANGAMCLLDREVSLAD